MIQPIRQLDVEADLVISHDLGEIKISGQGENLVVDLPEPALGLQLARAGSGLVKTAWLHSGDQALKGAGLAVDVRLKNRTVGKLGFKSRSGWLDRIFGLAPMQMNYARLLLALLPGR